MRTLILMVCLAFSLPVLSDENHGIGKITNDELDLTYIDHVLTGRVGDRPVFARPAKEGFGLYLWHRANGQDFESSLRVEGDRIKGAVLSQSLNGESIEEEFYYTEREQGLLKGVIGDRTFMVEISSEAMNGHHYINPHFLVTFGDGQTYEFDLKNSQACMGCSMKLTYAVLSMLYSYGTI